MKNLLILFFLLTVTSCYGLNKLDVKLTVVDENQEPVPDANVRMIFYALNTPELVTAVTDKEGVVTAHGETYIELEVSAEKEGYYKSQLKFDTRKKDDNGKLVVSDQDIKLILRKKVNPIALYAKKVSIKFPNTDKPIGFDLATGSFVAPYGIGQNTDLYLTMEKEVKSNKHFYQSVIITFPQEMDGFTKAVAKNTYRSSELKIDRKASIEGYGKSLDFERNKVPNEGYNMSNNLEDDCFLRIRTVVNEEGEIIKANYAKFKCESLYGVLSDSPGIRFTYYFNPEVNDRNLEFDPKRNLFTSLKNEELVFLP